MKFILSISYFHLLLFFFLFFLLYCTTTKFPTSLSVCWLSRHAEGTQTHPCSLCYLYLFPPLITLLPNFFLLIYACIREITNCFYFHSSIFLLSSSFLYLFISLLISLLLTFFLLFPFPYLFISFFLSFFLISLVLPRFHFHLQNVIHAPVSVPILFRVIFFGNSIIRVCTYLLLLRKH